MDKVKWKFENRNLADLTPHPSNDKVPALSEVELAALASDLEKRGQQHPIDILPDGTILGGHQRVRAAKRLGWTTIRCRIRYDLQEAGEYAKEEFLLADNLHRRQFNMLEAARQFQNLKDLAKKHKKEFKGDVAEMLAQRLGKTGRTLYRWVALLRAPIEVGDAVLAGKLKLVDGGRIANASTEVQQRFAACIRAGENPAMLLNEEFPNGSNDQQSQPLQRVLDRLLTAAEKCESELRSRLPEIDSQEWQDFLPSLERARKLLNLLSQKITSIKGTTA